MVVAAVSTAAAAGRGYVPGFGYAPSFDPFSFTPSVAASPAVGASPSPVVAGNFMFKTFDVPGALATIVNGINNFGVMDGAYCDATNCYGFIAAGNHIITVSPNGDYAALLSINDAGTAAGWYIDPSGITHGLVRSLSGAIKTIDYPNADSTLALGINDWGVVSGYYLANCSSASGCDVHGFTYQNGWFTTIDVPGSAGATEVFGINNLGVTSGLLFNGSGEHGFFGSPNRGFTTFDGAGEIAGDNGGTFPGGINDWGAVVGHSNGFQNYGIFAGWELRNGQMVTISDPLANTTLNPAWGPNCGCFGGTAPSGIHDAGAVVGAYLDNNETQHGFIATPKR